MPHGRGLKGPVARLDFSTAPGYYCPLWLVAEWQRQEAEQAERQAENERRHAEWWASLTARQRLQIQAWRQITRARSQISAQAHRPCSAHRTVARLNSLLDLRDGWDGHRAHAVTIPATEATVRVLASLMDETSAPPQLFPLPDGGLQIEWHVGGNSIEVEIDAGGEPCVLARTHDGATVADGVIALGEPDAQLLATRGFLRALSTRLEHESAKKASTATSPGQ